LLKSHFLSYDFLCCLANFKRSIDGNICVKFGSALIRSSTRARSLFPKTKLWSIGTYSQLVTLTLIRAQIRLIVRYTHSRRVGSVKRASAALIRTKSKKSHYLRAADTNNQLLNTKLSPSPLSLSRSLRIGLYKTRSTEM
jgi:hypothetical protein